MVWMPGHMTIDVNEIAGQGSSQPLTGYESALGVSAKVAGGGIREWTSRKDEKHWQFIHGQRQAKVILKKPLQKELKNCST